MIRKGFRPIVNSLKNAFICKNMQTKCQNKFISQFNQYSSFGFVKVPIYEFSQQKNDSNE